MNICVIGAGYVGLVTAACFAEFGVQVVCVDKDETKIKTLEEGGIPIYEPGLEDLIARNVKAGRLEFSTDTAESVARALVVFIAVQTPPREDGGTDLGAIEAVAREIGRNLTGYKVIVTKSTVPVGTSVRVKELVAEESQASGNTSPFSVASNPEFLREGAAINDFLRPERVVIGTEDEQAQAILKDLFRPLYLIETPFVLTNIQTAELIKYAANAFLATKISFINEVANVCEAVGADVHAVARAMGLDKRIGGKFLHPGPGFGGSCFPKDTRSLAHFGREVGEPLRIVEAVIEVNRRQGARMVEKISTVLDGKLNGATIGLLGLSFKPETDDMREAPSLTIIAGLRERGAKIRVFDPVAMDAARLILSDDVAFCENAYEAARGADALVIVTEWNQFRMLDFERIRKLLRQPILVDLRNVYEPGPIRKAGYTYVDVGR